MVGDTFSLKTLFVQFSRHSVNLEHFLFFPFLAKLFLTSSGVGGRGCQNFGKTLFGPFSRHFRQFGTLLFFSVEANFFYPLSPNNGVVGGGRREDTMQPSKEILAVHIYIEKPNKKWAKLGQVLKKSLFNFKHFV